MAPIVGILLTFLTVILLTADLFSRPDGVVFAVVFLGLLAAGTAYVLWRSRRQARA